MARLWSLKLQRIERLSMLRLPVMPLLPTSWHVTGRFSGTHALVTFQGPALISSAVRNVVAWQVANGPPVLRQSANQSVSPSLFMPPPGGLPALRRPARQLSGSQLLARQAESLAIRAKGSLAMQWPNINEHSTAGLLASPVASLPSLTGRSTRTSMLRMAAG
jgi:PPE-repeat protein